MANKQQRRESNLYTEHQGFIFIKLEKTLLSSLWLMILGYYQLQTATLSGCADGPCKFCIYSVAK